MNNYVHLNNHNTDVKQNGSNITWLFYIHLHDAALILLIELQTLLNGKFFNQYLTQFLVSKSTPLIQQYLILDHMLTVHNICVVTWH